ncbi:ATP-binding protein [Peterkaempfera sp. SMS 1(5)a]|uniref:ATP-binding protein n=1 Tax=Peterkaempfera podocarpi TaxID=3232308 RepID=UPI00366F98C3
MPPAGTSPSRPGELESRLTRHPASVARGRRLLRHFLTICEADHYLDPAELVLSELLTNAVRHGRGSPGREIRTRFELTPAGLRIAVSDADPDHVPEPHASDDPLAESGRGLLIVQALAATWGCDPRPHGIGKTVWALVRHGPADPP